MNWHVASALKLLAQTNRHIIEKFYANPKFWNLIYVGLWVKSTLTFVGQNMPVFESRYASCS